MAGPRERETYSLMHLRVCRAFCDGASTGMATGCESRNARVGSRGEGGRGGGQWQGGVSSPSQSAGQAAGFSLANSAGAGGTDRFSSRGGDRPGTGQGGVFLLRVGVEGEVRSAGRGSTKERMQKNKKLRNIIGAAVGSSTNGWFTVCSWMKNRSNSVHLLASLKRFVAHLLFFSCVLVDEPQATLTFGPRPVPIDDSLVISFRSAWAMGGSPHGTPHVE